MANALCVQVLQRGEHLAHVVLGVGLIKTLVVYNKVEKLATNTQLSHNVHEARINIRLKELNDVGVVH